MKAEWWERESKSKRLKRNPKTKQGHGNVSLRFDIVRSQWAVNLALSCLTAKANKEKSWSETPLAPCGEDTQLLRRSCAFFFWRGLRKTSTVEPRRGDRACCEWGVLLAPRSTAVSQLSCVQTSFAGPQWARWSNRSRSVHIGPGLRAGLLVPFPCSPLSCGGHWSTLVWTPPRCWALYKFFLCWGQGWCQSESFWKWFCEGPMEIGIIKSS